MRACIRDLLGSALHTARLTRPGRAGQDRLTIITLHRVLPGPQRAAYPLPGLAVRPERLAWLLGYFTRHYECGPLAEVAAAWSAGLPTARPRLAITFDDALADNFHHAAPVLDRFGVRATFFVPCDAVEERKLLWHDRLAWAVQGVAGVRPDAVRELLLHAGVPAAALGPATPPTDLVLARAKALGPASREALVRAAEALPGAGAPAWEGMASWGELAELRRRGHEIGSHSLSHPLLPQCEDADVEREIAGSRHMIEERTGGPVVSFCYPNGDFDERAVRAVERSGYRWAVTTAPGPNRRGASPFTLRRADLVEEHLVDRHGAPSEARLAWRLSGLHPGLR